MIKRLVASLIIVSVLLCGCSHNQTDSIEELKQIKPLDINIEKNHYGENEFSVTATAYIDNAILLASREDKNIPTELKQWYDYGVTTDSHGQAVHEYIYWRDIKVYSEPCIRIFCNEENQKILFVELVFADKCYTENNYKIYCDYFKLLCMPLMPDLKTEDSDALRENLYKNPTDTEDTENIIPENLYYKNNIGFYSYFWTGSNVIRIVPFNEALKSSVSSTCVTELPIE